MCFLRAVLPSQTGELTLGSLQRIEMQKHTFAHFRVDVLRAVLPSPDVLRAVLPSQGVLRAVLPSQTEELTLVSPQKGTHRNTNCVTALGVP